MQFLIRPHFPYCLPFAIPYSLKKYEDIPLFNNLCFVFVWMLDTRFKNE